MDLVDSAAILLSAGIFLYERNNILRNDGGKDLDPALEHKTTHIEDLLERLRWVDDPKRQFLNP